MFASSALNSSRPVLVLACALPYIYSVFGHAVWGVKKRRFSRRYVRVQERPIARPETAAAPAGTPIERIAH